MNKLTAVSLGTLVVSSLLAAPPAKKTEIPAGLQHAIEASRHAVEPDGAGFKANNPKQNMDLRFGQTAASVRLPDAEVRLRLAGYGRGSRLAQPEAATLTASKNRVEYRRGALTEWYVNDRRGLEQGFTVAKRPAGEGALVVALAVEGGLTPRLESTDAVVLERAGVAALRYGGLKAWDALGQTLQARMNVQGAKITLSVEDTGAAYPVTIDPWIRQAKLTAPSPSFGDQFGSSVAISGNTALVGASHAFNPIFTAASGVVFVFVKSGTAWTLQATLSPPDLAAFDGELFGYSVALSGDTAVIGAPGGFYGAAFVFVRSGTVWTQQAGLTAPDAALLDAFGNSVALSGETAIVGAYGYLHGQQSPSLRGAYVYVRTGTVWTQQVKLTASDGAVGDAFGSSVALSGDTALVAAGVAAPAGAAYVFQRNGTAWSEQSKLTPAGGADGAVALSLDTAMVASTRVPEVAVYGRSGTVWTQQGVLAPSDGVVAGSFGYSMALSGDTALVGALTRANPAGLFVGAAYVYRLSATVWSQQAILTASDGADGDEFGNSVGLDGDVALVGAQFAAINTGEAYVFSNLNTTANLTLTPSSGFPGANLTLSGSGFAPSESVKYYIYASGRTFATGTADSTGAATAVTRVAVAPFGRYDVVATGLTSGRSGTAPFNVTPRLVLSPTAGPAGSSATVKGYGFGAGETVKVYWNTPRAFLGTASADGRGSFPALTFTVPAGAPLGTNVVFGKGQTTLAIGKGQFKVQ